MIQKQKLKYKNIKQSINKKRENYKKHIKSIYNNKIIQKTINLLKIKGNNTTEFFFFYNVTYLKIFLNSYKDIIKFSFIKKSKNNQSKFSIKRGQKFVKNLEKFNAFKKHYYNNGDSNYIKYNLIKKKLFGINFKINYSKRLLPLIENIINKRAFKILKNNNNISYYQLKEKFILELIYKRVVYYLLINLLRDVLVKTRQLVKSFVCLKKIKFKMLKNNSLKNEKLILNYSKQKIFLRNKLALNLKEDLDHLFYNKKQIKTEQIVNNFNISYLFNKLMFKFKPNYLIDFVLKGKQYYKVPFLINKRQTQLFVILRLWSIIVKSKMIKNKFKENFKIELIELLLMQSKLFKILNYLKNLSEKNKMFKHYRWW